MKCPQCGKSSNVTISNKVYCTNCGAVISDNSTAAKDPAPAAVQPEVKVAVPAPEPAPQPAAAPAVPQAAPKMTDIAVPGTKPAPAAPVAAADRPVVTPITTARTMQDVMRPAAAYHNPALAESPAPENDGELKPITEHTAAPVPTGPIAPPSAASQSRLVAAQAVPKSDSIVKFHEPLPAEQPAPAVIQAEVAAELEKAAAPAAAALPDPVQPAVPAEPIVAAPAPVPLPEPAPEPIGPTAAAAALQAAPELPAPVVTQHEAMQNLVSPPAATSKEDAFKLAMEAATSAAGKPNPAAVGAAALAVVIMGGYIWLQNYPRMQLSAVAGRAGFTASLPGYMPSSYKLDGPINAKSGQVSLHYSAPGLPSITVSQKATSWDSSSLADNYVAAQDPGFASVQGQGLTIYLFGNGQASWINHGIWYSITGASRLSRAELLKLAYSL